jgi:DNA-binding winged helix-turn-helix (wHTH) protein/Tol biopolymer transport system component
MAINQAAQRIYMFGPFRLDPREQLLTCDGKAVPLSPKTLDTLLVLVQNAGRLVEKDALLRELWPETFVEEGNLTKHVSILRKVLSEFANNTEYIETVPKRGYRFVIEVIQAPERLPDPATLPLPPKVHQASPAHAAQPAREVPVVKEPSTHWQRAWRRVMLALAGLGLAVVALKQIASPGSALRAVRITQLTHSGRAAWVHQLMTDGARLYFVEKTGGHWALAWVPVAGGDPVPLPTPFPNTILLDISPDRNELLLASFQGYEEEFPLWIMPTTGGSPRRAANLVTSDAAAWLPGGKRILFSRESDLYVANQDGSELRRVATIPGKLRHPRWSPDGRVLRLTVEDRRTGSVTLLEGAADGTNLHPWRPSQGQSKAGWLVGECCGVWTPNGHFFYRSSQGDTVGLWALGERTGLFRRPDSSPYLVHATSTPPDFFHPAVSLDGKRIFFISYQESRELVRYDAATQRSIPYLSGVPIRNAEFSPDGNWVAYITQDWTLWRSRPDGSGRLQLTFPPLNAAKPQWSPDGAQIAFRGDLPDSSRIYLVSPDGGSPEPMTSDPNVGSLCWSPDGNSLIYSRNTRLQSGERSAMVQLDWKTRRFAELPGSQGLDAESFSPDGKYLAASTIDTTKLMLLDVRTRRWTELARGNSLYGPHWSRDSAYIYFQDLASGLEQAVLRVHVNDRRSGVVARLQQFARADVMNYSLAGLTPDGSLLASLILGRGDIYALDVGMN